MPSGGIQAIDKHHYFVKGIGFPDREPMYYVQHYMAVADGTGYLNAARVAL